jgi:hypothetical protein
LEPSMFHATLYAASVHLDILQEQEINPITVFHKGRIIQLINEKLNSKGALGDSIVGAIATLMVWEVSYIAPFYVFYFLLI